MPAKAAPDCGQCGNQARSDARFCDRCGAELSNGGGRHSFTERRRDLTESPAGAPDTVVDLDSAPDAATRLQFAKRLPVRLGKTVDSSRSLNEARRKWT